MNRRKITSVILFAGFLIIARMNPLQAQELKPNERYFGYFVNQQGDTVRGFILWSNKVDIQDGFEFSNDPSGSKLHFPVLPEDVCCFHFQNYTYQSMLYSNGSDEEWTYLLQVVNGTLKLYQYFYIPKTAYLNSGSLSRPVTGSDEQYLQWNWVLVQDIKPMNFSSENDLVKEAPKIFAGDEDLIQHIKNKEKNFRWEDMPQLVSGYDEWKLNSSIYKQNTP